MASLDEIVTLYAVERTEVTAWVAEGWVRPSPTPGGGEFDAVDEARIVLIHELRHDLQIEHEVVGIILSLLDELHTTRQLLLTVGRALAGLPEPLRKEVVARLQPVRGDGTSGDRG